MRNAVSHQSNRIAPQGRVTPAYSVKEVRTYRASHGGTENRELRATILVEGLGQIDYTPQEIKLQGGIWALLASWRERGFKRERGKIRLLVLSGKIFAHLLSR